MQYRHKVWEDCALSKKRFPFALSFSGMRDQLLQCHGEKTRRCIFWSDCRLPAQLHPGGTPPRKGELPARWELRENTRLVTEVKYQQAAIRGQRPIRPNRGKVFQAAVVDYCIIWVRPAAFSFFIFPLSSRISFSNASLILGNLIAAAGWYVSI